MTTTAIGASRVASERRSGSEFVQSNECEPETRSQTNMTTTTDTTATYQQIGKLREEALTVCDHMMAQICNVALGIGASLDGLTDAEGDRIWSMTNDAAAQS